MPIRTAGRHLQAKQGWRHFVTRITFLRWFFLGLVAMPLAAQTANNEPWLDLQSVSIGMRYRMMENDLGAHAQNWSDHHQGLKLRLKLDRGARYSLSAVALNGSSFTAGWNLRGRGESSEITSYDNDGYLMGQRLTVKDLTLTAGYLGDLRNPSVTNRLHRLSEINYGQILLKRRLTDRLTATADFTDDDGERTLRQAFVIRPRKMVDLIRLEGYERVSGSRSAGGAITFEKPFGRTRIAASLASVDDRYRLVNGDRYGRGTRISFTGTTALTRDMSLQLFVTRALDGNLAMPNRTRVDVLIRYELAAILRQMLGQ